MRKIIFVAAVATAAFTSQAQAAVFSVPSIRMPSFTIGQMSAPVAPTLSIVVPTAPVAPTLASILAARGFNLASMPRR